MSQTAGETSYNTQNPHTLQDYKSHNKWHGEQWRLLREARLIIMSGTEQTEWHQLRCHQPPVMERESQGTDRYARRLMCMDKTEMCTFWKCYHIYQNDQFKQLWCRTLYWLYIALYSSISIQCVVTPPTEAPVLSNVRQPWCPSVSVSSHAFSVVMGRQVLAMRYIGSLNCQIRITRLGEIPG